MGRLKGAIETNPFLKIMAENRDVDWKCRSVTQSELAVKDISDELNRIASDTYIRENSNLSMEQPHVFVLVTDDGGLTRLCVTIFGYVIETITKDTRGFMEYLADNGRDETLKHFCMLFKERTGITLKFVFHDKNEFVIPYKKLYEIQKELTNAAAYLYTF